MFIFYEQVRFFTEKKKQYKDKNVWNYIFTRNK